MRWADALYPNGDLSFAPQMADTLCLNGTRARGNGITKSMLTRLLRNRATSTAKSLSLEDIGVSNSESETIF